MSTQQPCWIVWSLNSITGTTDIRAICTIKERAEIYRDYLTNDEFGSEDVIRAWIESSCLNHFFGRGMLAECGLESRIVPINLREDDDAFWDEKEQVLRKKIKEQDGSI